MSSSAAAEAIARIRQETNRAQAAAADPATSAWVSANAGAGKTHVLTRRVLRLLIADTAPERILCLTYTKAAAAEMSTRVFRELGLWVTQPADQLDAALEALLGRPASAAERARARTLFARAIETPGGLKVQTIHAFAERLLQRFPLEAGVPPGFTILDDATARQLLGEAIDDTLGAATAEPGSPLGAALVKTVAYAVDAGFEDVLRAALQQRDWLAHVVRTFGHDEAGGARDPFDSVAPLYRQAFGLAREPDAAAIDAERAAILPDDILARAREVLSESGKRDQKTALQLGSALAAKDAGVRRAALTSAFLTQKLEPRADSQFCAKAVRTKEPALVERLCAARDRFAQLTADLRALEVIEATLALMRLADAVLTRFAHIKARRAALDFDDLIRHTVNLLSTSQSAQWVLFKLDGGLDHILVDESQDTSPQQWRIVEALAAEFFAGSGAHEDRQPGGAAGRDAGTEAAARAPRTLFAVGDEKQSIYSFQGARPEEFARMGALFRSRAQAAGAAWRDIPLNLSFRTVAPVLDAVDRVFADAVRTPGLTGGAAAGNERGDAGAERTAPSIRHTANRIGHGGLVEIWPTEQPTEPQPEDSWNPEAGHGEPPPAVRVAERIADMIKRLTEGGERLTSEDRPITPGDILILVRKRHPFAQPMIAALKARSIPVAGADRLRLTEQIAVKDLVSLGDFLTLPEDDLALANVLKSPLIGFDDDQLLAIAHGRRGSLWKALIDKRSEHPAFEEAASLLRSWRARADYLPPYEFLAGVLERDRRRGPMLARLGPEAADSMDELINLAIAFDDSAPPSLTGFLAALRESNHEVKRDMEQSRDEVRIMTVHGAKGLEAPIVFLPDTCSTRASGPRANLYPLAMPPAPDETPAAFVWQVKGSGDLDAVAAGRDVVQEHEREERNRLLYVAMTRARDRLYVAGFEGMRARPADCWYDLILSGLEDRLRRCDDGTGRNVLRYAAEQTAPAETPKGRLQVAHQALPLAPWAMRAAPRESQLTMPLAPSRLAPYDVDEAGEPISAAPRTPRERAEEPAATPPRQQVEGQRFLRGTLTHALLEHLPHFPAARWQEAATAFIAARGGALAASVRRSIVGETLAILTDSAFAPLFGPESRAEVAIAAEVPRPSGRGPALRLSGQIDRLAVIGDSVFIVDYKTNRPPPEAVEGVAEAYMYQLAAYRLALGRMFPGKVLRAAILWTDGPRLMEIPEERLSLFENRLWDLDPASLDAP